MYWLFLDDIRNPEQVKYNNSDWIIARNYDQAVSIFKEMGWPSKVSFDHDLGESDQKTGFDFAKFLVEQDLENNSMPLNFSYEVHSANPVGEANIRGYLDRYLKFKKEN